MELIEKQYILESKVEAVLERLRPFLQQDGGDIELVEITSGNAVRLRFLGTCSCCNMSSMTFKASIEDAVKNADPEITLVEIVN